jgi:serpin B
MSKISDLKNIVDSNLEKIDMSQGEKLRLRNEVKKAKKINFKRLSFWGMPAVAAIVAFIVLFNGIFPSSSTLKVSAQDLMKGITGKKVETVELKDDFIRATANFSVELFKQAYNKEKNSLVSPTSVYLALGMTANGAEGNTLKEFETLLGKNDINIKELNSYYNSLSQKLTKVDSGKLNISNSIWYKDDNSLEVKKDFLQNNADYYNAAAYKADFADKKTVSDINNWVKFNTDNNIDKIIDEIKANTIMYLINTIYFEDKWQTTYEETQVHEDDFKLVNGEKQSVDFMHSKESWYLKDDMAEGFIKPYQNGKYSFIALLPKENVSMDSYITSLSGERFIKLLKNKSNISINAALPKFKSEYEVKLIPALEKMGLKQCFDAEKASFTKMATSNKGNIFISDILHKTFITVDTEGTKAAAVTKVEMETLGMATPPSISIILNRPFIYGIVDNETNLPVFMGTMMNPK